MSTGKKLTYPLLLGLLAFTGQTWGLEPVERIPIADFVAVLKSAGHERIAQGMVGVLSKDVTTGKLTMIQSPLMVTTNKQTGDWSVSMFHDKITGGTLLTGHNLHSSSTEVPNQPTFNRQKIAPDPFYPEEVESLKGLGYRSLYRGQIKSTQGTALDMAAAYRQQEVDSNIVKLKIDGEDIEISQGDLRNIMSKRVKELEQRRVQLGGRPTEERGEGSGPNFWGMKPLFADVLATSTGAFCVLIVDQYGRCATIAIGDAFSEKR